MLACCEFDFLRLGFPTNETPVPLGNEKAFVLMRFGLICTDNALSRLEERSVDSVFSDRLRQSAAFHPVEASRGSVLPNVCECTAGSSRAPSDIQIGSRSKMNFALLAVAFACEPAKHCGLRGLEEM